MSDLRRLIRRVQNAGGPIMLIDQGGLGFQIAPNEQQHYDSVRFEPSSPFGQDVTSGILRRDMVARDVNVASEAYRGNRVDKYRVQWWNGSPVGGGDGGFAKHSDNLVAHLLAWLDAAGQLGW